jgi:formate hydrogenlyase subunit 3/multisubunit Na+/H+ antiporter MnhD subunit
MSTPVIWIILPIIIGLILVLFQKRETGVVVAGSLVVLTLAIAALRLPMEGTIVFGPWRTLIEDRITFAGVQFILSGNDRSTLIIFFSTTAFIFGGSLPAGVQRRFVPVGIMIIGLIIAALSIEPVVYGVFFFQLAVLLCVLLLSPPGKVVSRGVLRYLIFQIIGLAFIILGVWLFSDVDTMILDLPGTIVVTLMLGIGFVCLFAIFPLYTWVTMIAEDDHPYAGMFVFSMMFGAYTQFFLDFLGYYGWLLDQIDVFAMIRFMGVVMAGTGGVWAAFQRNMGRIFGYAVVIEVGNSLLSIGIQDADLYNAMLIPRLISLALWALGLSILRKHSKDLRFKSVQGMAWQYPVASGAVLFANFSIAGLPLLAGFPVLLTLWSQLASISTSQAVWSFLGSIGLMVAGFRSLAIFVMSLEPVPLESQEDYSQRVFLILGVVGIFLLGLFPHWLYPIFYDLGSTLPFFTP